MKRAFLIAALAAAFAGPAAAQSPAELIAEYEAKARALTEHEAGSRVAEELGTLRAWLTEARKFMEDDEPRLLQQRLELARAQIRLIEASIERARIEAAVRQTRREAEAREKAAADARNEAFRLEQRLIELEQKARAAAPAAPVGEDAPGVPR